MYEVAVLERCALHPHIGTLLDVAKVGRHICLVLELWGFSLAEKYKQNAALVARFALRTVQQCLQALQFLHHLELVHADFKPSNILVIGELDDGPDCGSLAAQPWHVKLSDLGSCVCVDHQRRPHIPQCAVLKNEVENFRRAMRLITTMPYRAPEIVFGDLLFGPPIDLWALGIMMYHLAGITFTYAFARDEDEPKLVAAWCVQLGAPAASELVRLEKFPFTKLFLTHGLKSTMGRSELNCSVQHNLGFRGVRVARQFLSWSAYARGSAQQALDADLFFPERLTLVPAPCDKGYAHPATSSFTGVRHLWNCAEGQIAPEILRHMIAELPKYVADVEKLFNVTPRLKHLSVQELGNATKYTIAGWLTAGAANGLLNGMEVKAGLPFLTVRQWRNALVLANKDVLDEWHEMLKQRLEDLDGEIGQTGEALKKHYNNWLWAVAECHITHRRTGSPKKKHKGAPLASSAITEELHNDGSASGVHLGLTWSGKRTVRFLQEAVHPSTKKQVTTPVAGDVELGCFPGHVYLGGVTGGRHQVIHSQFDDEECLLDFHPGPCSVTFMLRSCIFADRSRSMNTTPSPKNVWQTFTSCVRHLVSDSRLRLPTYAEYRQAPQE